MNMTDSSRRIAKVIESVQQLRSAVAAVASSSSSSFPCPTCSASSRCERCIIEASTTTTTKTAAEDESLSSPHAAAHSCFVISVPFGKGQDRPGVEQAPEAIKGAGLRAALNSVNCRLIDVGSVDMTSYYSRDGENVTKEHPSPAVPASGTFMPASVCNDNKNNKEETRSVGESDDPSSQPHTVGSSSSSSASSPSTAPTQAGDDVKCTKEINNTMCRGKRQQNQEGCNQSCFEKLEKGGRGGRSGTCSGVGCGNSYYTEEEIKSCEISGECCKRLFKLASGHHCDILRLKQQQGEAAKRPGGSSSPPRPPCLLVLGGDHGLATGSIAATLKAYPEACVLWVDAHGDINIPELSPSGNYHGMPVAHLMRFFQKSAPGFEFLDDVPVLRPDRIAYLGLRDIDVGEREIFREFNIATFDMTEITRLGICESLQRALARIDPDGVRPIHLSFDVDGVDYDVAPGTGTRARGGLTYREALFVCHEVGATGRLITADIVEVNPKLDVYESEKLHGDDPNIDDAAPRTVRLAIEMAQFLNGKSYCMNNFY